MERICKNCILPENYAGISFNKDGICNLCESYHQPDYLGEEKLKQDISKILENSFNNRQYDCIVGFSGGRDSTYLLWYIVNVLHLKPLAVFVDSKLIPQETLSNIKKTSDILEVDLLIKQHDLLTKSVKHFLTSWVKYPVPATLITLCTGCRLGVTKIINEETIARNIPVIFAGGTPFERGTFKKNLLLSNKKSNFSFMLGYSKQVLKNPSLISDFNSLKIQISEYFNTPWGFKSKKKNDSYIRIEPFFNYFRWEEKKIEHTIQNELNWKKYPGLKSAYRGDCEVGIIRQFLYDKMLGYNDKDDHLSWLVRDEQVTREEALSRIKNEKETSIEILISSFKKLELNYYDFINELEKNASKHMIPYKENSFSFA